MDTKINDLESCAIAPVIDALVPELLSIYL